ncbi:hypothetical protein IW261DRAFT_1026639 [Armillaria novae-zelandiae]|uniref:Uncharacterized protein n=1 Tax=Armillaria novae-zelandiae TaxID=153914 RepID=A0AA39UK86_9AGAR|nr:hypothetical protein IW261DRAFT_1026639 [Armillaria novae-zelandiae]
MNKALKAVASFAVKGNSWTKFTNPTAARGKTAFPKTVADQERLDVRFDYDKEVEKGGEVYHKFDMQPNAGKIPTSIKNWREAHGGTHAVMADVYVKKDGTQADVEAALQAAIDEVRGV